MRNISESRKQLRRTSIGLAVCVAAAAALWLTWPAFAHEVNPRSDQVIGHTSAASDASPWTPDVEARHAAARKVLASRLDVPAGSLTFVSEQAVNWPDTSLGCGGPGEVYAKVIVPGYRITFAHEGDDYEVHTAEGTKPAPGLVPVSCEGGQAYSR